jgi:hypothetical protein
MDRIVTTERKANLCYKHLDILAFIILISFVVYFMFKVNGYLDFSGKYGISSLFANWNVYDLELILDNDTSTQWGMPGSAKSGDYLDIEFRHQVLIESIDLTCSVCPKLDVYLYNDKTDKWQYCSYSGTVDMMRLEDPIITDRVRIVVTDGYDDTEWGVQEINFVFNEDQK